MADPARARKVADRIKVIVAEFLENRIKDERLGFVTVTDVRVTGDLQHASVFYTVFGSDEERTATAAVLEEYRGRIRSAVGKGLGIRLTPSLEFIPDALPEGAAHLEDLLAEAKKRDEEVAAADNSLTRLAAERPELLEADFAILGEPTSAGVEGGCKGTMKLEVTAHGVAAHSARDWVGENAIHRLAPVLERLASYEARRAVIDGLEYRECLNVVSISGGIAGNVIPDRATALVNFRFAPDTGVAQAEAHVREVLAGLELEIEVVDSSPGALPGLDSPAARGFLAALGEGVTVAAKQGWTDVARFAALGTPAVNFGPGDPLLAHTDDEHVPVQDLEQALEGLRRFLIP